VSRSTSEREVVIAFRGTEQVRTRHAATSRAGPCLPGPAQAAARSHGATSSQGARLALTCTPVPHMHAPPWPQVKWKDFVSDANLIPQTLDTERTGSWDLGLGQIQVPLAPFKSFKKSGWRTGVGTGAAPGLRQSARPARHVGGEQRAQPGRGRMP
jgi:hypothetical protein